MRFMVGIMIQFMVWLTIFSIPVGHQETIFDRSQAIVLDNPLVLMAKAKLFELIGFDPSASP